MTAVVRARGAGTGGGKRQHRRTRPAGSPDAKPGAVLDLAARVLYRDALMLIIDKPAGLPVHAGPGGGPNLEMSFASLRFGLPQSPALAHRLDRDTSGCLVLGRHRRALARLNRLFAEGLVDKVYWAVAAGEPAASVGVIDAPLLKSVRGYGWRMLIDSAGRPAVSDYRLLASRGGESLIEVRPRTGRTHQVRVHLASIGCPVFGDPVYGPPSADIEPAAMLLHARRIAVPLYANRPAVSATAPLPAVMSAALARLGVLEQADRLGVD